MEIIQDYINTSENIGDHQKREQELMKMISRLLVKINEIAKEGDFFEVADNLCSAAYYMEELDFNESQEIYLKAIEYYEKYMKKMQKEGKFEEASWTANQISEIYYNKLKNKEMQRNFLIKCIEFTSALAELSIGLENPKKIALIYYNLGELYLKIDSWNDAEKSLKISLELAEKEKYYDILSNIYSILSDIYLFQGNEKESLKYLNVAKNYFLEQEKGAINEKDNYKLSQIYQIMKNLSTALNSHSEFIKYSRKEAIAYINLAKEVLFNKKDHHKFANFYRGAALCFKNSDLNTLDSASCFIIAGLVFDKVQDFHEASQCLSDAAEIFESMDYFEKSVDLYNKAAEIALKYQDYEFAIEKLINSYNVAETNDLEIIDKLAIKIKDFLREYSEEQAKVQKYFIAGTLLLESLSYLRKIGYENNSPEIIGILKKIDDYYTKDIELNKSNAKNSIIFYILTLVALAKISIHEFQEAEKIIAKLDEPSKITQAYKKIAQSILDAVKNNTLFDLSSMDNKIKNVFSNSEEIKLFNNFLFY